MSPGTNTPGFVVIMSLAYQAQPSPMLPTCMSRSLWYVVNGFAAAPPGIMFIMGVSTSRNSRSSRKRRTNWMIRARVWKMSRMLLLHMRSRYRWR